MELVFLIAVLICPLVMGTAMLLMWREMRRGHVTATDAPSPPKEHRQTDEGATSETEEVRAGRAS
jgi:hypothetical protein